MRSDLRGALAKHLFQFILQLSLSVCCPVVVGVAKVINFYFLPNLFKDFFKFYFFMVADRRSTDTSY